MRISNEEVMNAIMTLKEFCKERDCSECPLYNEKFIGKSYCKVRQTTPDAYHIIEKKVYEMGVVE